MDVDGLGNFKQIECADGCVDADGLADQTVFLQRLPDSSLKTVAVKPGIDLFVRQNGLHLVFCQQVADVEIFTVCFDKQTLKALAEDGVMTRDEQKILRRSDQNGVQTFAADFFCHFIEIVDAERLHDKPPRFRWICAEPEQCLKNVLRADAAPQARGKYMRFDKGYFYKSRIAKQTVQVKQGCVKIYTMHCEKR